MLSAALRNAGKTQAMFWPSVIFCGAHLATKALLAKMYPTYDYDKYVDLTQLNHPKVLLTPVGVDRILHLIAHHPDLEPHNFAIVFEDDISLHDRCLLRPLELQFCTALTWHAVMGGCIWAIAGLHASTSRCMSTRGMCPPSAAVGVRMLWVLLNDGPQPYCLMRTAA